MIDRLKIGEVIANLLSNAIYFTPVLGEIKIWVELIDKEVVVHVKDNGKGVPKEAVPHLFSKFFRVTEELQQGSQGLGLGLFISKYIIERHRGKIWAESERSDRGSTFSFSLPIKISESDSNLNL